MRTLSLASAAALILGLSACDVGSSRTVRHDVHYYGGHGGWHRDWSRGHWDRGGWNRGSGSGSGGWRGRRSEAPENFVRIAEAAEAGGAQTLPGAALFDGAR